MAMKVQFNKTPLTEGSLETPDVVPELAGGTACLHRSLAHFPTCFRSGVAHFAADFHLILAEFAGHFMLGTPHFGCRAAGFHACGVRLRPPFGVREKRNKDQEQDERSFHHAGIYARVRREFGFLLRKSTGHHRR